MQRQNGLLLGDPLDLLDKDHLGRDGISYNPNSHAMTRIQPFMAHYYYQESQKAPRQHRIHTIRDLMIICVEMAANNKVCDAYPSKDSIVQWYNRPNEAMIARYVDRLLSPNPYRLQDCVIHWMGIGFELRRHMDQLWSLIADNIWDEAYRLAKLWRQNSIAWEIPNMAIQSALVPVDIHLREYRPIQIFNWGSVRWFCHEGNHYRVDFPNKPGFWPRCNLVEPCRENHRPEQWFKGEMVKAITLPQAAQMRMGIYAKTPEPLVIVSQHTNINGTKTFRLYSEEGKITPSEMRRQDKVVLMPGESTQAVTHLDDHQRRDYLTVFKITNQKGQPVLEKLGRK